jgi:hypothetical protein
MLRPRSAGCPGPAPTGKAAHATKVRSAHIASGPLPARRGHVDGRAPGGRPAPAAGTQTDQESWLLRVGQRSAWRRPALRAARRDTAVTAESAWDSVLAVRVDGSRRPAASARRWTSARISGRAMASSSHIRSRLEKNAHMLRVPSSSQQGALRYPPCPGLTRSRALKAVQSRPGLSFASAVSIDHSICCPLAARERSAGSAPEASRTGVT